jgi:hypothetical protein
MLRQHTADLSQFITFHTEIYLVFFDQGSKTNSECLEKISKVASLRCAFELFDANFFNNKKVTLSNL